MLLLDDDDDDDDDGRGAKRVRLRGPVYDRGEVARAEESDEDDLDERRAEAKRMAAAEGLRLVAAEGTLTGFRGVSRVPGDKVRGAGLLLLQCIRGTVLFECVRASGDGAARQTGPQSVCCCCATSAL